uniref:Uncharacterized protein n=1 Tax=Tanacetum cinerariifolium TaxID=118510 RepID=A0A699ID59_TANCI|nr:hypothetical protein [Tanacetum cinerariifolium]
MSSMDSKLIVKCEDCFDDCVGAKGGVVSGAGVVIGVMSNLVKEKPGGTNGIGGGYPRGVDGILKINRGLKFVGLTVMKMQENESVYL